MKGWMMWACCFSFSGCDGAMLAQERGFCKMRAGQHESDACTVLASMTILRFAMHGQMEESGSNRLWKYIVK